ncbi:hypothetical protein KKA00_04950 [bacterium]|nr:hypothetical protein [bacterium]MBU1651544.1 hypothetical protein [bacterium]
MKILIVCSQPKDPRKRPGAYDREYDCAWAERFIQHLSIHRDLCTGCGDRCIHCRDWRVDDHSANIIAVLRQPSILSELLEVPVAALLDPLPPHDILIAIQIHEEILIELPALAAKVGCQAIIAPVEAPDWVSRWAKNQLLQKAKQAGIEAVVPKPFCDLRKGAGPVIDQFIDYFRIGYPQFEIETLDGKISKATARICAPCGNSHYVAHNLQGYPVDENLSNEVSHYWHAFPCTASMKQDSELGDTILHRGGQIHMETVRKAVEEKM